MNYVYINSEKGLWTVGFYDPEGKWRPESDHDIVLNAIKKTHYLNGGNDNQSSVSIQMIENIVKPLIKETIIKVEKLIEEAIKNHIEAHSNKLL